MSDTTTETKTDAPKAKEPKAKDLTKISAGTFGPDLFGGAPADAVKHHILNRAGIKVGEEQRKDLPSVHLLDTDPDLERVPKVFPSADYAGPLQTVADWLALVDAVKAVPPPPPIVEDKDAPQENQQQDVRSDQEQTLPLEEKSDEEQSAGRDAGGPGEQLPDHQEEQA